MVLHGGGHGKAQVLVVGTVCMLSYFFFCSWFSQINSDATVQKAWDERWVAGFVDRRESEEMLKQSGAGSVL